MKAVKTILLLPIRILIIPIEIALIALKCLIIIAGKYLGLIGGLVGGIFILGSFACLVTGVSTGMDVLKMFLTGVALGAIPEALVMIGEGGIDAVQNLLWKVCF